MKLFTHFKHFLLLISAPYFAAALPSHQSTEKVHRAASCYNYVLISTRGTFEAQGPCPSLAGMINQTLTNVPGGVEYDTVYPAADNGTEVEGAENIRSYIEAGLQSCPCQKYALLGYSQGATASAIAMNYFNDTTSAAYNAIRAVVLIGDPVKKANEIANVDENGGDSTRSTDGVYYELQNNETISAPWYSSGKLLDICYSGDLVCNGLVFGASFIPHLLYQYSSSVQNEGARWLESHLG